MLLFYTIPYLFVFFAVVIYHSAKPHDAKGICLFTFFFLSCFAGFSYDVGWDYIPYIESMKNGNVERYEFLERLLIEFCVKTNNLQLFFIVNHFAISGLIALTIKKATKEPYLALLAYLSLPFMYLFAFSTIRAALVMAITIFAYEYMLKDGKWVRFVALIIVGFFIHNVSLIGLLLLPLHYINFGRIFNIAIIIVSYAIILSNIIVEIPFMNSISALEETNERYLFYTESGGNIGGQSMIHVVYLLLIIANLFYYKRISQILPSAPKYILFVSVGYCLHLLFQYNPVFSSRFSRSFYAFELLIVPSYVTILGKKNMRMIRDALLFMFLALFVYQLCLHNYNGFDKDRISTYLPYRLFFLQ